MATRRLLRRPRRRALALTCVALLAALIVAHHAEPPMGSHAGHHDPGGMAAMELCLGAFVAVGAAVAAVALGVLALGRWKAVRLLAPVGAAVVADVPAPVPRAGPDLLALLCVSRR